jgi:hypothetical protein
VTEWLGRDRKACSYVSTVRPSTTNLRFEAMPGSIKDEFILRLPTLVKAINKAAFIQSRAETHINDIVGL